MSGLFIKKALLKSNRHITITGSKSETNRALLLQALFPSLIIHNSSNSDDSQLMQKAFLNKHKVIDIHHAGTAMRFLTAYYAIQEGKKVVLTGSSRMKERPIKILVDALKDLGADINYLEAEGCPPLEITGRNISKNNVELLANVSSQYISALLLVAPILQNGIELNLKGKITSVPYIKMTLALLNEIGVETEFRNNMIIVYPFDAKNLKKQKLVVESDWSSASYFYSLIALSNVNSKVTLSTYKRDSLQGDSILKELYEVFGVETQFCDEGMVLTKISEAETTSINFDLSNAPDIAQTISVTSFGLGLECYLTGLHTLKIKETDRLTALKVELEKLGAEVDITKDSLHLKRSCYIEQNIEIDTYNDHRMAMAFAPLALKTSITINDHEVVSKSYPDFWEDMMQLGIDSQE